MILVIADDLAVAVAPDSEIIAPARAALDRLQWKQLQTETLAANDLPALRAAEAAPRVFMKPGSYDWPNSVWPK